MHFPSFFRSLPRFPRCKLLAVNNLFHKSSTYLQLNRLIYQIRDCCHIKIKLASQNEPSLFSEAISASNMVLMNSPFSEQTSILLMLLLLEVM